MKRIIQRRRSDCGVACVAMLAGVPYEVAAEVLFPGVIASYTSTLDLRKAFIALGRSPGRRLIPLRSRVVQTLQNPALLKAVPDRGGWHWVVWSGKKILDPRPVPYRKLLITSYLPVQ